MGKRVPNETLLKVLKEWRGKVSAAAEELGLSEWSIRKRVPKDVLKGLRRPQPSEPTATLRTPATATYDPQPLQSQPKTNDGAREKAARNWQSDLAPSSLSVVNSAAVAQDEEAPAIPAARSKQQPPARLKPDQEDQLTRFRLKLQSLFGVEWSNGDILQWLFREQGDTWFDEKCKEAAQSRSSKERPR